VRTPILILFAFVSVFASAKIASIKFNLGLEHPEGNIASDVFTVPAGESNTLPLGNCKILVKAEAQGANTVKVELEVLEGSGPTPKSLGKSEVRALWGRTSNVAVRDTKGRLQYRLWVLPQQNVLYDSER
jgi:hypothetical protein